MVVFTCIDEDTSGDTVDDTTGETTDEANGETTDNTGDISSDTTELGTGVAVVVLPFSSTLAEGVGLSPMVLLVRTTPTEVVLNGRTSRVNAVGLIAGCTTLVGEDVTVTCTILVVITT